MRSIFFLSGWRKNGRHWHGFCPAFLNLACVLFVWSFVGSFGMGFVSGKNDGMGFVSGKKYGMGFVFVCNCRGGG